MRWARESRWPWHAQATTDTAATLCVVTLPRVDHEAGLEWALMRYAPQVVTSLGYGIG